MEEKSLKKKTLSGLFWAFGERILAQLVSFIVSIVLARLLLPEQYGVVTLCNIFITICNVFVTSGFGSALVQKKDADDLDFSSILYSSVIISIVLYTILFFTAPYIAAFYEKYDQNTIISVIRIMSLRLPLAAYNSVQHAYVSKKMMFKKFFWSTLFGTIVSGGVGIFLAYKGYGVYALVFQYLTNVTIDTIVLTITLRWFPKLKYSFTRFKTLFKYGWKLLVSSLLDTGYNELRSLVIGKKYSSSDLAYYDKGRQFPSLIVTNINSSIDKVLFPVISELQDDKVKVKETTRRAIKTSSYVMFPLLVGLAVVAEPVVKILLTNKWIDCVPFLQIMCFVYAFYPIHTANLQAIKAMGRSDLFLVLEIVKKVLGIVILIVTMRYGVLWIALGQIISAVISSLINSWPNRKLLNYGYLEQIKDIMPSLLAALFMGVCVYLFNLLSINIYLKLVIQVLVGALIYFAISIIFKLESYNFLKSLLFSLITKKNHSKE